MQPVGTNMKHFSRGKTIWEPNSSFSELIIKKIEQVTFTRKLVFTSSSRLVVNEDLQARSWWCHKHQMVRGIFPGCHKIQKIVSSNYQIFSSSLRDKVSNVFNAARFSSVVPDQVHDKSKKSNPCLRFPPIALRIHQRLRNQLLSSNGLLAKVGELRTLSVFEAKLLFDLPEHLCALWKPPNTSRLSFHLHFRLVLTANQFFFDFFFFFLQTHPDHDTTSVRVEDPH